MSSYKKAQKTAQRSHKERSQPHHRARFGLLEKKKDYQLRAKDYREKQTILKKLKKKALEKNPDEFHHRMISSRFENGENQRVTSDEPFTVEQQKLMDSQDVRYVDYKRNMEAKKIEKMKGSLHLLEASTSQTANKHTFFVNTKKEAEEFDVAKHLNTHPALLGRTYNRPTLETLKTAQFGTMDDELQAQILERATKKQYYELSQRIEREKQLNIIDQKMQTKVNLKDKGKKQLVKQETNSSAVQYKWYYKRKR